VPRPEKELKGFAKVYLEPGERRLVRRRLAYRDFAYWDVGAHRWAVAPGTYHILVGGASDAIRLDAAVTVP
jgi:beta-glucosidase